MPNTGRFIAVSLGVGADDLLTYRARESLSIADTVFLPSKEKSWMFSMVQSIVEREKIRLYMPQSTEWGVMLHDPIHDEIAKQIAERVKAGETVCFASAGDVSVYSPFKYLADALRPHGIKAEVVPGVSFFNAISLASRSPLVSEQSNLLVAHITDVDELDVHFRAAETIVLYDTAPVLFPGLRQYAIDNCIDSMDLHRIGVRNAPSSTHDLLAEDPDDPFGLIVLKKRSTLHGRSTTLPPFSAGEPPFAGDIRVNEGCYRRFDDGTHLDYTLFSPQSNSPLPCLLLFHGGAWEVGSRDRFFPQAKILAELGMAVISMDYRIKSKHGTSPLESVNDARFALEWACSNAVELGIDPYKIVMGGGSAGGHIAACCSALDSEEFDPNGSSDIPKAMILFNPVTDTSESGFNNGRIPGDSSKIDVLRHLSPNFPPCLVFHGIEDTVVPFANTLDLNKLLCSMGVPCKMFLYEGQPHGFFNHGAGGDNTLFFDTLEKTVVFLADLGILSEGAKKSMRTMKNADKLQAFVKSNNQIAVSMRQSTRALKNELNSVRRLLEKPSSPPKYEESEGSTVGRFLVKLMRSLFRKH